MAFLQKVQGLGGLVNKAESGALAKSLPGYPKTCRARPSNSGVITYYFIGSGDTDNPKVCKP